MRYELLSPDEQRAVREDERVWRRAHDIATAHPGLDPGDVYHTILQLQRTPAERLAIGLRRGRLAPHRR